MGITQENATCPKRQVNEEKPNEKGQLESMMS